MQCTCSARPEDRTDDYCGLCQHAWDKHRWRFSNGEYECEADEDDEQYGDDA